MKKIVQYCGLLLLVVMMGCKSDPQPQSTIDTTEPTHRKTTDVNVLYQHYYDQPKTQDENDENAIIDYVVDHDLSPTRSITGLYYQIDRPGMGDKIKFGDYVEIHYRGTFLDGSEFDSSYNRGKPLKFTLGSTGLIQGWIEGLRYLNEGAKAKFIVPSRLAYQDRGWRDVIPPGTPLAFEIEVVKVD